MAELLAREPEDRVDILALKIREFLHHLVWAKAGREKIKNVDAHRLRRFFQRLTGRGQIRSCCEASGAGCVLHRWISARGYTCELVAPSLIPTQARRPAQA